MSVMDQVFYALLIVVTKNVECCWTTDIDGAYRLADFPHAPRDAPVEVTNIPTLPEYKHTRWTSARWLCR